MQINKIKCIILLTLVIMIMNIGCSKQATQRICLLTDIHFDGPKNGHTYGGVHVDKSDTHNYIIPVKTKDALDVVSPDLIFDNGDLTNNDKLEEYIAYSQWKEDQVAPIYAIHGGHDRRMPNYGEGFYSILGNKSATRTLKMGNLVFILVCEDFYRKSGGQNRSAHISLQKFEWIESQLKKYSVDDNNIFIFSHQPINGTVAWSNYWHGLDWEAWKEISSRWKSILTKYQDNIVAHISGHMHTHYAWKDTPADKDEYIYGDGLNGVENIGHFVNGSQINKEEREYPPHKLPEIYFLNPQALCYTHGSPYKKGAKINTSAIYYGDLVEGDKSFTLITRDIFRNQDVDSYTIETDYPIKLGDMKVRFMESDVFIRKMDKSLEMTLDNWFKIYSGESVSVVFQKVWRNNVDIEGVEVMHEHGSYSDIQYRSSSDGGNTWSEWSVDPPEDINVLQVRVVFNANKDKDMSIWDVKIDIR